MKNVLEVVPALSDEEDVIRASFEGVVTALLQNDLECAEVHLLFGNVTIKTMVAILGAEKVDHRKRDLKVLEFPNE